MGQFRVNRGAREVEDGFRRDAESGQFLLHAPKSGFEATAVVSNLVECAFERLHAAPPLVPFLHAEQDRVHVDHRPRTGADGNQPFGPRGPPEADS